MAKIFRWGILGAGKISNDFCIGLSVLPRTEHRVHAVGARSLDNAKNFAREFGIPKAYGSYEELVKDPEIDCIYIGTINTQHLANAKLAMRYGKNVLLEKPAGMNVKELQEILECARENKVFFMEGIWSRFTPVYQYVKKQVEIGAIGDVLQVIGSFGVLIGGVDRVAKKELGGGTILDIGVYVIQLINLIFPEKPEKICAAGHLNQWGVDESVSASLIYPGGKIGTLMTHSRVMLPNEAFIVGTKGTLKIEAPFWVATKVTGPDGVTKEFPVPPTPEKKEQKFSHAELFSFEAAEVRRCVQAGLLESPIAPHKDSMIIAEIEEAVRKQVGVVYPQD